MSNGDLYLLLARRLLDESEGKTREEQERVIANGIRRVSEGFRRVLEVQHGIESEAG